MQDAHTEAVLAPGTRDTFKMEVSFRELAGTIDPAFSGLVFPGAEPEKPDIATILEDPRVPQEVRERAILAVEEAHVTNMGRVGEWEPWMPKSGLFTPPAPVW